MHPANRSMFLVMIRTMKSTLDAMEQALLLPFQEGGERPTARSAPERTPAESLYTTEEEDTAIGKALAEMARGNAEEPTAQETMLAEFFQMREAAGFQDPEGKPAS